jgi:hypothetical protein
VTALVGVWQGAFLHSGPQIVLRGKTIEICVFLSLLFRIVIEEYIILLGSAQ